MRTTVTLSKYYELDDLTFSKVASQNNLSEQYFVSSVVVHCLGELAMRVLDECKVHFPDLKINSGFRCRILNAWVKGVPNSQHIRGQAADITCDDLDGLWNLLKLMNIDQCIRYKNFIHVSYNGIYNRHQYIVKC